MRQKYLVSLIFSNLIHNTMDMLACKWDVAKFLIFSDNVYGVLVYYSHIPAIIISFLFGLFVFLRDRKSLLNRVLFFVTIAFGLWVYSDLVLWATERPDYTMFFWALEILLEPIIYAGCLYMLYIFVSKKDFSVRPKLVLSFLLLPVILLLPTKFAILGFNLTNCDRAVIEGPLVTYAYFVNLICIIWMVWVAIRAFIKAKTADIKRQTVLFSIGIILFLLAFSWGNLIQSVSESWQLGQIGIIGMPIFIAFLSYLIVKFKTFNIRLLSAQVLVVALLCLVVSILFIRTIENARIVVAFTVIFILILGRSLIRGVKKEVDSREKIEELAKNLVKSNDKLESANIKLKELDKLKSEFLSLASHQIRNPLTAIKGYASLVLDGTYGEVSQSVREAVDRMYQSTQSLVVIVSDFLDISRIEQGTMKYDFTSFDIKKLAEQVVGEFKPNIMKAGLTISSLAGPGDYFVNADQGKIKQVIGNLIDNAIKYTPKGSIKVALSRHSLSDGMSGRVCVEVSDSGVGIDKDVIPQLFAKFTRDKDAFRTNVGGTGLGLYLAKQMIQAHHGKIWAESDGKGKGSRLIFELDGIR